MVQEPGTQEPDRVAAMAEELRLLRLRNAELTTELASRRAPARSRRRWRDVLAVALAVGAVVLVAALVPAVWLRNQVLDTDRYLATVMPLGRDPMVQREIAVRVAEAINQRLDVQSLARDNLPPVARPLAAPIAAGVRQFVIEVTDRFTGSAAFVRLWDVLNRVGHEQVVAVLTGRAGAGGARVDDGGRLLLDLGPVVEAVKRELVTAGLAVVGRIPPTSLVVQLARVAGIDRARTVVRWLDRAATWLPWLALISLVAALLLAANRPRMAVVVALSTVAAMLLLRVALTLLRDRVIDSVPEGALSPAVAGAAFDEVTGSLRAGGRLVAVLALLVALAAALSGPAAAAVRARGAVTNGVLWLRRRTGTGTGRVGVWVSDHRAVLRAAVGVGAALTVLFWAAPRPVTLLGIAAVAVAGLLAIEFVAGRPSAGAAVAGEAAP